MKPKYLLSDVDMGEDEVQAVADVIRGKWLSVGPKTADFERQFADTMGAKHAVALSSCTAALHLALAAVDVVPRDEVLVPSYSFVASANAILYQRASPVFVEIRGAHDLNLSVDDLEAKITPRTKAVVVVHLAGFPADMDAIMKLANQHGLAVIEDACHAIGAEYSGSSQSPFAHHKAGTIGHAGCFSFFANKNMVTGEGGMLVTNDADLADRVRLMRSHGMTKTSWDKADGRAFGYDVACLGYNYRCTELTSAMGMVQLAKLAAGNDRRRQLVSHYRQRLASVPSISIPFLDRLEDSAHHIFPIVLRDGIDRESFRQALNEKGIQSSVHYPPIHQFTHYREIIARHVHLPLTDEIASREVTLPLHPLLNERDVDVICDAVEATLEEACVSETASV